MDVHAFAKNQSLGKLSQHCRLLLHVFVWYNIFEPLFPSSDADVDTTDTADRHKSLHRATAKHTTRNGRLRSTFTHWNASSHVAPLLINGPMRLNHLFPVQKVCRFSKLHPLSRQCRKQQSLRNLLKQQVCLIGISTLFRCYDVYFKFLLNNLLIY